MSQPRTLRVVALSGTLGIMVAVAASPAGGQHGDPATPWRTLFARPSGPPPSPSDNPLTPEKIALGARLFADLRLSGRSNRSCATCHVPARAFTDGRQRAQALSGSDLKRNTASLWNLAWGKHFFWDGRAPSLEAQVGIPIESAQEMAGDWATITHRLGADEDIACLFRAAFPDSAGVSRETIVKALSTYVRSLVSPRTRFDAWIDGDTSALRPAEMRGFSLFVGKAGCVLCHVGWRFTDDRFHDIGLRSRDGGRGALPEGAPGLRAFKTPGLRELVSTSPYMHDGSLTTLPAVIDHYSGRLLVRPSLAPHINPRLRLMAREKLDLIAFLRTLSQEKGPAHASRAGPD